MHENCGPKPKPEASTKKKPPERGGENSWRRSRDSNPRTAFGRYSLSRRAPSASRSLLRMRKNTIPEITQQIKDEFYLGGKIHRARLSSTKSAESNPVEFGSAFGNPGQACKDGTFQAKPAKPGLSSSKQPTRMHPHLWRGVNVSLSAWPSACLNASAKRLVIDSFTMVACATSSP